ncbi:GUN4 domain-containing protein [Calothrix sp. NIES-4101]|nr:GUN4 domain-containing protein [Calothrix sp. NIES-4101]
MTLSGNTSDIDALRAQLVDGSEKVQQQLIPQLAGLGDGGFDILMEFLYTRRENPATWLDGKIYQLLLNANSDKTTDFLQTHFPEGVVPLKSDCGINYQPLQQLLAKQDFEAADKMTIQKMCEVAGESASQRKWLYFTEVDSFPVTDLHTINKLWIVHSEGKFGFTVQREIWLAQGKNWDNLWTKIGWKDGNNWTRYPNGFTWDLNAPRGHLPLSNQLRGVRVIAALFTHPAWESKNS